MPNALATHADDMCTYLRMLYTVLLIESECSSARRSSFRMCVCCNCVCVCYVYVDQSMDNTADGAIMCIHICLHPYMYPYVYIPV